MSIAASPRNETARDSEHFARRLYVLAATGAVFFAILIGRLTQLCIVSGEENYRKSVTQILRKESIPASRGIVYDRFGRELVTNEFSYTAYLRPFNNTSGTLSQAIENYERLAGPASPAFYRQMLKLQPPKDPKKTFRNKWATLTLAENLSMETAGLLAEQPAGMLAGISVEEGVHRVYETRNADRRALSHVIGYIGRIDEEELAAYNEAGIALDLEDSVGRKGIEKRYDKELRGSKGEQIVIRDSFGRAQGDPEIKQAAESGADLVLTLDAELQSAASKLMDPYEGALVAMDPRNGEILALVSKPEYSYPPTPGAPQSEWNRAIRSSFAPGSTFKVVTAAAGLREQVVSPATTFVCDKEWHYFNGVTFKCMFNHGPVNLAQALTKSCNIYFYQTASMVRWGPLAKAAEDFGFGVPTDIDIVSQEAPESAGTLLSPGGSQLEKFDGNVTQLAIGQGRMISVTPLQLLNAYASIANKKGILPQPHVLKEVRRVGKAPRLNSPPPRGLSPAADPYVRQSLIAGLDLVANDLDGTAYKAGFRREWQVASKTGSAQWTTDPDALEHAWFVGFAPTDNPTIAIVVLCENSGHGGDIAAPIAKEFLQVYFDSTLPKEQASGSF